MALLFTQAEADFIVRTFCGRPDANAVHSSAKHKQMPPHSPNGVDDPLDALLFCDLPLDHSPTNEIPHVCLAPDCHQRTQATRGYCRQHGATKRCAFAGCPRGPQRGGFCITHGGGRRCTVDGCNKAVQTAGLCKSHGGGIRCGADGCDKSSQGGGYCRKHGGGKRCQAVGCDKSVQRGSFCVQHGGVQYCKFDGCHRTDRGGGCCDVHRHNNECTVGAACHQGLCAAHKRRHVRVSYAVPAFLYAS
ncbi:hypothetical protein SPRG_13410 [Saprolegnia parasitica CBS 223.65]|uniref:WRKY19-like zinc finger domain-containing protein n=1 Tax=Saprolegnia parasitica (strain CBS 223.65) TaxID=695850 RepID=A0A067C1J2_SAPPC|nr:hypothetical protein SPRG_13410 [Saprolegnia parasitica CBS 223.65]KDO20657.1 hypothetical protein SPRG_13410 [Saprolegnia parasitica CBS 223.65]|eukprot:XP_012208623.1 hypothetical protein SPRG_13410 [Saprolegnia parasitica CBS 223.65]